MLVNKIQSWLYTIHHRRQKFSTFLQFWRWWYSNKIFLMAFRLSHLTWEDYNLKPRVKTMRYKNKSVLNFDSFVKKKIVKYHGSHKESLSDTFYWIPLFYHQKDHLEHSQTLKTNYMLNLNKFLTTNQYFFHFKVTLYSGFPDIFDTYYF